MLNLYESDITMILEERKAEGRLSEWVSRFLYVEATHEEMPEVKLLPTGAVYFTVVLGETGEFCRGADCVKLPRRFIGGQITTPGLRIQSGQDYIHFGIEFRAWTLHDWLRLDLEKAENNLITPSGELFDRISEIVESSPFVFAAVCEKLEALFSEFSKSDSSRISEAARLIYEKKGKLSTGDLAVKAGLSTRHFRRVFKQAFGISPKDYAKLIQLNAAFEALADNEPPFNMDLVYKGGYFDESHFIRRFKELLGSSPADFLSEPDDFLETYLLRNSESHSF